MTDEYFLDTNVLIYAYDSAAPAKQAKSLELLDRLASAHKGVISTQVLSEFFSAVTRKLDKPLSYEDGLERLNIHSRLWNVLDVTKFVVLEAARGVREHQMSFWDAQIWAAAKLNQVPVIFSEDFNAGSFIEGVTFVNPFSEEFKLQEWLP